MSLPHHLFVYRGTEYELTRMEYNFLYWICHDLPYKEIAKRVGKSPRSLDGVRDRLFDVLGIKTRTGLILWCFKTGLFQVSDIRLHHRKAKKKPL
jgi:DNA-binding CsgD family transcriptional regulator